MSADLYYYEVPRTWADAVRERAASLAIRCMRFTDFLATWEWLDDLRWWIEGIAVRRKCMMVTRARKILCMNPLTREQWVRCYGDPAVRNPFS